MNQINIPTTYQIINQMGQPAVPLALHTQEAATDIARALASATGAPFAIVRIEKVHEVINFSAPPKTRLVL